MIEVECLGSLAVTVDGDEPPPELLWRKHAGLLVYLARSPRGRTRDHLIGLLWPEKDDAKARHSLNEALRVLRRTAGAALQTDGDTVRLAPGAVSFDLDRLDAAVIRGPFLEGFSIPESSAFEDWLVAERERVAVAVLDYLDEAAEQAIARGALAAARERAGRALQLEPRHEAAVRALMRVYALEGRRVLALQAYDRLTALLERDYGLAPAPETSALADRVRDEPIVRGATVPEDDRDAAVPLFGAATADLHRASDVWREVLTGEAAIVVVRGAPGTGKTRIADEMAARGRLDGAVVALARALDSDGPEDLWLAFLQGGLAAPELGGAAPRALAALARLDPDLEHRFPGAGSAEPLPLDEAVRHAVYAVAEARPVLLALDDGDRAPPVVLATLSSMVQRSGGRPIGVIVTAREQSEAVDVLCEHLGRDVPGRVLKTHSFDEAALRDLVRWAFPAYDPGAADRLRRRVMAETAGNPFLAVEYVQAVRSGLLLSDDAVTPDVWPDESRTLDQTMPGELPETIAAVLRRRFRDLSEAGQAALCTIAVVGGTHPVAVLARAADRSVADMEGALDELEWKRWISGDARGYTFVTKLAREVVLHDMVTGGQRRRIRERVNATYP